MSYRIENKSEWHGEEVKIKGRKVVNKSAFEIGLVVEGQAKVLAPRITGRLAASYTTQAVGRGTSLGAEAMMQDVIERPFDANEVLVGTAVDYGPYVEFGTVHTNAQPHLRPAFDLAKGKKLTIMERNGRLEFRDYLK